VSACNTQLERTELEIYKRNVAIIQRRRRMLTRSASGRLYLKYATGYAHLRSVMRRARAMVVIVAACLVLLLGALAYHLVEVDLLIHMGSAPNPKDSNTEAGPASTVIKLKECPDALSVREICSL
jgi:hypothetical protein